MRLSKEIYKEYKEYPVRVLQFGEGNFLRAFVDWQINILNKKLGWNGSVAVVQPIAQGLVKLLSEQDGLYTLYLQGIKDGKAVREHSVINCISTAINPYTQYDEYLKLAENPELRFIFSNTTEAGIAFVDTDTLADRPQKSFPAKLTALLYHRFKTFNGQAGKGFLIIPCELIDRNGDKLKAIVLKYAALWKLGESFITWINTNNTFCCSLVDRIVPGYPRTEIAEITAELGYEDSLVDVGEQFHLWVIEGPQSIYKELPFDKAGLNVKVVNDITPYRTRKVRILNGAHTSLMPVAYLYGIDSVGEAMANSVIGKFVHGAVYDEIIPTLDLPAEELSAFAAAVAERFSNPYVHHLIMSISLNSMSKYETRVLPSLTEYLKRCGKLPKKLVFSLAALIEFYKGKRGNETIAVTDDAEIIELFANLWNACDGSKQGLKKLVTAVLAYDKVWKSDLNNIAGLTDAVTNDLYEIENKGMKEAVLQVL